MRWLSYDDNYKWHLLKQHLSDLNFNKVCFPNKARKGSHLTIYRSGGCYNIYHENLINFQYSTSKIRFDWAAQEMRRKKNFVSYFKLMYCFNNKGEECQIWELLSGNNGKNVIKNEKKYLLVFQEWLFNVSACLLLFILQKQGQTVSMGKEHYPHKFSENTQKLYILRYLQLGFFTLRINIRLANDPPLSRSSSRGVIQLLLHASLGPCSCTACCL